MPQTFLGAFMAVELQPSDLRWGQRERAARVTFTEPQRCQLLKALNHYLTERERSRHDPGTPEVRRRLTDIGEYARTLASWLGDSSDVGTTSVALSFPFGYGIEPPTLAHIFRAWALGAQVGLGELPSQPGAPDRNAALDWLVREWHRVYREAGGKGKRGCYKNHDARPAVWRGPFLDLLDGALRRAATIAARQGPAARSLSRSAQGRRRRKEARQRRMKEMRVPRDTLAKRIIRIIPTTPP